VENGEGGGTPPPSFLQTNTEAPVRRGRGGQPGNRNAVKLGLRTAEMNALRAEVRIAVQKAKALAAMAWVSASGNPETRRREAADNSGD
jgi:hypothetical protein